MRAPDDDDDDSVIIEMTRLPPEEVYEASILNS